MRNILAFSVLAALLVATVALAKPFATADITQLGASGISGNAEFSQLGNGTVKGHVQLSGLTPGVTYDVRIYAGSSTCGAGTVVLLEQVTANKSGKANINKEAPPQVNPGGGFSISVETGGTLMACGEIQ